MFARRAQLRSCSTLRRLWYAGGKRWAYRVRPAALPDSWCAPTISAQRSALRPASLGATTDCYRMPLTRSCLLGISAPPLRYRRSVTLAPCCAGSLRTVCLARVTGGWLAARRGQAAALGGVPRGAHGAAGSAGGGAADAGGVGAGGAGGGGRGHAAWGGSLMAAVDGWLGARRVGLLCPGCAAAAARFRHGVLCEEDSRTPSHHDSGRRGYHSKLLDCGGVSTWNHVVSDRTSLDGVGGGAWAQMGHIARS